MDTDIHQLIVDNEGRPRAAAVHIGNCVRIGANAIISKGVSIEGGAVMAVGSVVTRDVAAHTPVTGNPARPIHGINI